MVEVADTVGQECRENIVTPTDHPVPRNNTKDGMVMGEGAVASKCMTKLVITLTKEEARKASETKKYVKAMANENHNPSVKIKREL